MVIVQNNKRLTEHARIKIKKKSFCFKSIKIYKKLCYVTVVQRTEYFTLQ